jgi:hypothetical protein
MIMNELDKLRVLIPHWISHNEEHADEFKRWAEGAGSAAADILTAANAMMQVNASLKTALEKLGGPLEHPNQDH